MWSHLLLFLLFIRVAEMPRKMMPALEIPASSLPQAGFLGRHCPFQIQVWPGPKIKTPWCAEGEAEALFQDNAGQDHGRGGEGASDLCVE